MEEELRQCQSSTTKRISFEGQTLLAKPLSVYDGDTANFAVRCLDGIYKFRMRLARINTPEMNSSEGTAAISARNRLIELLSDQSIDLDRHYSRKEIKEIFNQSKKLVQLKCGKMDKFGRCLVDIFQTEDYLNINDVLVKENLATVY